MKQALPRLHAITDERIARRADLDELLPALTDTRLAAHARGHLLSGREHYELAVRLSTTVRLFVNDRLDIALAARAEGVQLSRSGLLPENPPW